MTTIPHQPRLATPKEHGSLARVLVPEMWASLAIVAMWVAVVLDVLFGPDLVSESVAGDTVTVPSAVVVALFAFLGTWVVARYGFARRHAGED